MSLTVGADSSEAIRFGCEFESILDVPTFNMTIPPSMTVDAATALYEVRTFSIEIQAWRSIIQEKQEIIDAVISKEKDPAMLKMNDKYTDAQKAIMEANLAIHELQLAGPSPRKYFALVQRHKKDFLSLKAEIENLGPQEKPTAVQEKLDKIMMLIREIPIPPHDRESFQDRCAPHISAIEKFSEFEKSAEHWNADKWTAMQDEFDAAKIASDNSKNELTHLIDWESKVIAAWMNLQWTKYNPKHIKIGMINEFDGMSSRKGFGNWAITADPAIEVETTKRGHCFAFEFVGPILQIASSADSQTSVSAIMTDFFEFLTAPPSSAGCGCELILSKISTSTHIHFAPSNTEWTLEQAQRVICSAYFWDPCVRYLIPYWRRLRAFCPDMRAIPGCGSLFPYPREIFQDEAFLPGRYPRSNWEPEGPSRFVKCTRDDVLGNLNFIMGKTSKTELKKILSSKNVGWNVLNLKESDTDAGAKDTIEWRRGSAALDWMDAVCWIELIFAFARAAWAKGTVKELTAIQNPDMQAFKDWLDPYRFDKSLKIRDALDLKFTQAMDGNNSTGDLAHPLYINLAPGEEVQLEKDRAAFEKQTKTPIAVLKDTLAAQRPLPSTVEENRACEPVYMTAIAQFPLDYQPTEFYPQYTRIMDGVRERIRTRRTTNVLL